MIPFCREAVSREERPDIKENWGPDSVAVGIEAIIRASLALLFAEK
jgi:hypothetical protein